MSFYQAVLRSDSAQTAMIQQQQQLQTQQAVQLQPVAGAQSLSPRGRPVEASPIEESQLKALQTQITDLVALSHEKDKKIDKMQEALDKLLADNAAKAEELRQVDQKLTRLLEFLPKLTLSATSEQPT